MIKGTNNLNLDAKGRMIMPTKYRHALIAESEGKMVITISPNDRCLWLYTAVVWEQVERKIVSLPTMNAQSRELKRMLIGHAEDCVMDGSGRLLLSAPLREHAGLTKHISLVGQGDKFEIWSESVWSEYKESLIANVLDENNLPADLETMSF